MGSLREGKIIDGVYLKLRHYPIFMVFWNFFPFDYIIHAHNFIYSMKRLLSIFIIVLQLLFSAAVLAGTGSPQDEPSKKQNGKNLVLMCLSAHPDDEDGATLAYYAKLNGVKTYSIFYTRGEGGQNETGSELYDDLGALRTKETLAAAKVLGSEVYFLGFPD